MPIDYRQEAPQLLLDFLSYHETIKAHSQRTVDEYFLDLRNFFRYLKQTRDPALRDVPMDQISIRDVDRDLIASVTLTDIYGYMTYLSRDRVLHQNSQRSEKGLNAASRARKLATIRSFYGYLCNKVHVLEENPVKDMDSPKLKKTLPRYLTLEESMALLDSVDGPNRERDYCILTLFLNCGLRISELIGLNRSDIQGEALHVLGKGNKVRIVYLNEACQVALEQYLAVRRPITGRDEDALFLSQQNRRISRSMAHEAIIDQQTFDLAQKIRSNVRRYPNGWGEAAPLTGLLYCADCGGKMYVHRTNNGKRISQYTCSNYTKVPCGTLCPTQHRINESAVLTLVSDTLRAIAEYSKNDRTEFIHTVQETQVAQQSADIAKKRRRLAAAQKRSGELEKLICKIYEDNTLGKLPDARYRALDAQYAKEQDALEIEITELEKAVTGYEQSQKSAEKFIALIDKYENFDTLTNTMLNEFVEKILVHERARKGSQDTTQEVEIYFNFVGRYIPPALQPVPLTPEEQEELRKKEERKDRLHQNYLRRKANGKQKEWEKRYNAKRKAQVEAAKATIRAEDMEKGIFTTVSQLPRQEPRKATVSASATV